MSFKNVRQILTYLVSFLIVFIIQVTFLGNFNILFRNINLILIILIFLVGISDILLALIYAISAGFLMDVYSDLPFGIFMVTFFVTFIVLEVLMNNLLTNRSYYSLVSLGAIGVVVYSLLLFLVTNFLYIVNANNILFGLNYLGESFIQLINSIIIISLFFWIINKVSSKFKPMFLSS